MVDPVTNPSRTGDIAEHYVVTWLWDTGYEVFMNAGCSGPIDIVAVKDGQATLIDVKSYASNGVGLPKRSDLQKELGVVYAHFNPKTRKCRWVKHIK